MIEQRWLTTSYDVKIEGEDEVMRHIISRVLQYRYRFTDALDGSSKWSEWIETPEVYDEDES